MIDLSKAESVVNFSWQDVYALLYMLSIMYPSVNWYVILPFWAIICGATCGVLSHSPFHEGLPILVHGDNDYGCGSLFWLEITNLPVIIVNDVFGWINIVYIRWNLRYNCIYSILNIADVGGKIISVRVIILLILVAWGIWQSYVIMMISYVVLVVFLW